MTPNQIAKIPVTNFPICRTNSTKQSHSNNKLSSSLTNKLFTFLVYDEQKNIDAESKRAAAARDKALEQEKAIKKPTVKDTNSTAASSKPEETKTTVHMVAAIPNKKRPGDKVEKATDDFFYEKFKKRARDSWRYQ